MLKVRFRHTDYDGQIVESDLLICLPEEWAQTPEKTTGEWSSGVVDLTNLLEGSISGIVPALLFALKLGDTDRVALPLSEL